MLADEREINLRPWLYRIARNRCLNHLRKPTADAQESMDMVPMVDAASTAEKVHNREEFRQLLSDVSKLPETQRSALLLREMDAMSYEEIAQAMETSVPSVKSLLVRARISLAEASQARQLTCGEVRLELAEAAEGLRKVSGPVRRHVRDCDECSDFRTQVRSNDKVLAALFPAGPLLAVKGFLASKLGFGGGASGGAGAGAAGAGAGGAATGAVGSVGAAISGSGAASGIGAVGGAIGSKAVAGVVTAAVLTAGAVEVKQQVEPSSPPITPLTRQALQRPAMPAIGRGQTVQHQAVVPVSATPEATVQPTPAVKPDHSAPDTSAPTAAAGSTVGIDTGEANATKPTSPSLTDATPQAGSPPASGGTVVVTVGGTPTPPESPPAEEAPPPSEAPPATEPAAESPPPAESPEP
jgi:DNA-directed RNA polymerase specialized sigma24 family protein